jgi:nitrite reductase/ring-hydroxylating ferredoxin subunit
MEIRIEEVSAWPLGKTQTFSFLRKGKDAQGFAIRHETGYAAYLNQCCHWPVPLDIGDEDFYHPRIGRIVCKSHGAVYEPTTGVCEAGPCVRARLENYPVKEVDGALIITVPDAAQTSNSTESKG